MSNLVLNGGVSNVKYIQHVESDKACEACQSLDGTEYEYEGDIPDRLHPNCRCYIEIVENDENSPNQEPCDCWEQIQAIMEEVDELEGEIEDVKEEALVAIHFLEHALQNPLCYFIYDMGITIAAIFQEAENALYIFKANKAEMETIKNSYDKYYHAKANCEATKLGEIGELAAYTLSIGKEVWDLYRKVYLTKELSFEDAVKDCTNDLIADEYGIRKGHEEGQCKVLVKDVRKYIEGHVEKKQ